MELTGGYVCKETLLAGRISTDDLLVLTSSDQLRYILKPYSSLYKTTYFNEEVNRLERSPSVRVPCNCVFREMAVLCIYGRI
jgi:hypothetical protein